MDKKIRFRPSSHSEDVTIICEYSSDKEAQKAEDTLKKLLEDMKEHEDEYRTDWSPDDARVNTDGNKVIFEVYTAGYLTDIWATVQKPAIPKKLDAYSNYQELEIQLTAPEGATIETLMLTMRHEEADLVKELNNMCGKPKATKTGKSNVYTWAYSGDSMYNDDGTLWVGSQEYKIGDMLGWQVTVLTEY